MSVLIDTLIRYAEELEANVDQIQADPDMMHEIDNLPPDIQAALALTSQAAVAYTLRVIARAFTDAVEGNGQDVQD